MKTFLKIKLKELAAEGRANALERKRWQKKAQRGLDKAEAVGSKPKLKAWMHYAVHQHRLSRVRPEARATQLAYGFLKGLPYHRIEQSCYTAPNWKRVEAMIRNYNEFPVKQEGAPDCYFRPKELEERFAQFKADGQRCIKKREPNPRLNAYV